jgi:hypothetical protein
VPKSYLEDNRRYKAVAGLAVECQPARNGSGRISIVKIHYREKSGEDTAEELPLRRDVAK